VPKSSRKALLGSRELHEGTGWIGPFFRTFRERPALLVRGRIIYFREKVAMGGPNLYIRYHVYRDDTASERCLRNSGE